MKNCYKKIGIIFVVAFAIIFGNFTNAFATDKNESIKINNMILNFNRVIYVDEKNGNDKTGDGSKENSYKSIQKAQEIAIDGNAIYIKKGIYDLSSTGYGLYEAKHKITFIGEADETIIISDGNKNSYRDNHAAVFEVDCSVYNIVFKYNSGNRTENYSCALIGSGSMSNQQYGNFYNCAFLAINKSPSPCYGNRDINVNFKNCSFIIPDKFQATYTGGGLDNTKWINCAINKDLYKESDTSFGNLNISKDDYSILSDVWENMGIGTNPDGTQSNVGVYGGEFAWGNWKLKEKTIYLNKSSLTLKEYTSEKLTATTTPSAINIDWSSSDETVATVDSNGNVKAIKEGQATITAKIKGTDTKADCIVTVTKEYVPVEPEQPTNPEQEYIVNTAYAKGDNTNNASGQVSIIFKGVAETQLKVIKTADVDSVYVGDNFTYTIEVTNTSDKIAKSVVIKDSAPNHIQFIPSEVITTQGKVDSSSTSKSIIVNVGDIPPLGKVIIKIPVLVVE